MGTEPLRQKNHYVPSGYLKQWHAPDGELWVYRTLVSHPSVPLWRKASSRGVAYHLHLYTRIVAGRETDEIERWFHQEFETPGQEALEKAVTDSRMTTEDWANLIRLVAAQDVRTPARLVEQMRRWHRTLPALLEETLEQSVRKLEHGEAKSERSLSSPEAAVEDGLPIRVFRADDPQQSPQLGAELMIGRGLWLWNMKRLLQRTARVLNKHKWTVFRAPEGLAWYTSDDPVLRLNFMSPTEYNFGGGWDSRGTEIIVPLSPKHLLYTQIGERPPCRGTTMPREQAKWVRQFLAEHAYRMVIAQEPDDEVHKLRPREVDADIYQQERQQWEDWHREQGEAEIRLAGWGGHGSG